jgi:hypothetical protein
MPRKAAIADLISACEQVIPCISEVSRGEDDGSIWATFTTDCVLPIEIELMIQPGKSFRIFIV